AMRLRKCMTLEQVEAPFGLPGLHAKEWAEGSKCYYWYNGMFVQAIFTDDCHLMSAYMAFPSSNMYSSIDVNTSFLDTLRRTFRALKVAGEMPGRICKSQTIPWQW